MVKSAFIISDIHLGASTSLLTAIDYDFHAENTFERTFANEILDRLINDIKEITQGKKIQQLILLGDIFDLSFAPYGLAMQNGKWFFRKLIESQLFEEFVYIPGNHDHHIWQQINEQTFLLNKLDNPQVIYPRTLSAESTLQNTCLDGLLDENNTFKVTYPNYKISINNKNFYFHHGHFLQKLYIVASNFLSQTIQTESIEDLEALNSPFLEFGWYNLGQAYNIGKQKLIDRLYLMFKSNNNKQIDQLIKLLFKKIHKWNTQPKSKFKNPIDTMTDYFIENIGPHFLKRLIFKHSTSYGRKQQASSVRHKRLTGSLNSTVSEYINKYLISSPAELNNSTFIFGHTHEPENDLFVSPDGQSTYRLCNPGGWVVDRLDENKNFIIPAIAPLYIDEEANVIQLEFTKKHYSYLRELLDTDSAFIKLKEEQLSK
jgi:UDP-2,3-diacylglucosamine pyrophosphatase LpxH